MLAKVLAKDGGAGRSVGKVAVPPFSKCQGESSTRSLKAPLTVNPPLEAPLKAPLKVPLKAPLKVSLKVPLKVSPPPRAPHIVP